MAKKKILDDHKQLKKKLIPPMMYMLGPITEVSWAKSLIPELLWIALLQDNLGHKEGAKHSIALAEITSSYSKSNHKTGYAAISAYTGLTNDETSQICKQLRENGQFSKIADSLRPLNIYYPKNPLFFLSHSLDDDRCIHCQHEIERIKKVLVGLYDKRGVFATMIQATAIYNAFGEQEYLKISRGMPLTMLFNIDDTCVNESVARIFRSIHTASSVINGFLPETSQQWQNYFWNQGLKIEPCAFEVKEHG